MAISMVSGPLRQATFVSKFRFTLEGYDPEKKLVLYEYWIRDVNLDFTRSQIDFSCYEVLPSPDVDDLHLLTWLEQEKHEGELVFTTYDGCGNSIYQYRFSGLVVVQDNIGFDYSASGQAMRNVSVKFSDYTRTYMGHGKSKTVGPFRKRYEWRICLEDRPEVAVQLVSRPTLNVEEDKMDHLNDTFWIPGKSNWDSLRLQLDREHANSGIIETLLDFKPCQLYLSLYAKPGNQKLETWTLADAWATNIIGDDTDAPQVTLRYGGAKYQWAESS